MMLSKKNTSQKKHSEAGGEEDIIERKNSEKIKKAEMEPAEETEKKEEGIADAKKKTDEYLSGWKRAQADFENYKKDQEKRMIEFRKFANLDIVLQILPVIDNFESSLAHIPEKEKDSAWVQGILHIKKQLEEVLKNSNVMEIETKIGDEFNPVVHEAVQDTKETNIDTKKTNKIKQVLQKGYKIESRIIRPVKVIVS